MLDSDFLREFKQTTEAKWRVASINPKGCGFQFQRGTRWNPGLTDEQAAKYERDLRAPFPPNFRTFLRAMNGTDMATVNVYGSCGEPHRESVGVYCYPTDIEVVKQRIEHISSSRAEITADLAEQGFGLPRDANLVRVFAHRYMVCSSNLDSSLGSVYCCSRRRCNRVCDSLKEYLEENSLKQPSEEGKPI